MAYNADITNWLYELSWIKSNHISLNQTENNKLLIISKKNDFVEKLGDELRKNHSVYQIILSDSYDVLSPKEVQVASSAEEDYHKASKHFNETFDSILHLGSCDFENSFDEDNWESYLDSGLYSQLHTVSAFKNSFEKKFFKFFIINTNSQLISDNTFFNPVKSASSGLIKILIKDYQKISSRYIDISGENDESYLLNSISEEIFNDDIVSFIAYRNGNRYLQSIENVQVKDKEIADLPIKKDGNYLIFGGLSGIGYEFASNIGQTGNVNLHIVGRREVLEKSKWNSELSKLSESEIENVENLKKLESYGSNVNYHSIDIEDSNAVNKLFSEIGNVNGIVNCAGSKSLFMNTNEIDFERFKGALKTKLNGTFNIEENIKNHKLDFYMLSSSLNAVLPEPRTSDYTVANVFLDEYSKYRNLNGNYTLSVKWPNWAETGMAKNSGGTLPPIKTQDAIDSVRLAIKNKVKGYLIVDADLSAFTINPYFVVNSFAANDAISDEELADKLTEDNFNDLEKLLARIWINILKPEKLSKFDNFFEIGGHSLLATTIAKQVSQTLKIDFDAYELFEAPTIIELQEYILDANPDVLSRLDIEEENTGDKSVEHETELKQELEYDNRVAIIGFDLTFPQADNAEEFWDLLKEGRTAIRPVSDEMIMQRAYSSDVEFGNYPYLDDVVNFDHEFFDIPKGESPDVDPQHRLFMQSAWKALEDAGYGNLKNLSDNMGIFTGLSRSNYASKVEDFTATVAFSAIEPMIGARVSFFLNNNGPVVTLATECSSSFTGVHMACQSILSNECDMAVVGGANIILNPSRRGGQDLLGINSNSETCLTFDDRADGTLFGEGSCAVILKSYRKAIEDGDNIRGVILGTTINHDGHSSSLTAPNPKAQERLIKNLLSKTNINAETISYIEAHGTATKLGDPIEIKGITGAFKSHTSKKQFCAISSVKPSIGHLDSISGLSGLIKTVLLMQHKQITPTANYKYPNKSINFKNTPVYVSDRLHDWNSEGPRRAIISSFGASGSNSCIMVEEYIKPANKGSENKEQIFVLSARSEKQLSLLIDSYLEYLDKTEERFEDICYTSCIGRSKFSDSLVIISSNIDELKKNLKKIKNDGFEAYQASETNLLYSKTTTKKHKQILFEKRNEVLYKDFSEKSLLEIAKLYLSDVSIDWYEFFKESNYQRVSAPTYIFEKNRAWYRDALTNMSSDVSDWFYNMEWKDSQLEINEQLDKNNWIIFSNHACSKKFADKLNEAIIVKSGEAFEKISDVEYIINISSEDDYQKLHESLSGKELTGILNLLNLDDSDYPENEEITKRISSHVLLVKSFHQEMKAEGFKYVFVSNKSQRLSENEKVNPLKMAALGTVKGLYEEYENANIKHIDLNIDDLDSNVDLILNEMANDFSLLAVAYRAKERMVQTLSITEYKEELEEKALAKENGVYIVSGGAKNVGLEVSRSLAKDQAVKLVIIGRSELPDKSEWTNIKDNETITDLLDIESNGTELSYYSADVSSRDKMSEIFDDILKKYKKIDGIAHVAGIHDGNLVKNYDAEEFEKRIKPKVHGTVLLDELSRGQNLDFFILFSSTSSLISVKRETAYTAGNLFLDAYSMESDKSRNMVSINWPAWRETGMWRRVNDDLNNPFAIRTINAIKCMGIASEMETDNILVSAVPPEFFGLNPYFFVDEDAFFKYRKRKNKKNKKKENTENQDSDIQYGKLTDAEFTDYEEAIAKIWGDILKVESFSKDDIYFDVGGNSLNGMQVTNRLEKLYGIDIEVMDLFDYPTISELAEFVLEQVGDDKKIESPKKDLIKLEPIAKQEYYDVSQAQKRLWIIDQIDQGNTAYNVPVMNKFNAELDEEAFKKAIFALIERHESLRTSFTVVSEKPMQKVHDYDPDQVEYRFVDLSQQEDAVEKSEILVKEEITTPFELEKGPICRTLLVKLAEKEYIFCFNIHHIVVDGWSMSIVRSDLKALYDLFRNNSENSLQPLTVQYKDYAAWEKKLLTSEQFKPTREYWLSQFNDGVPKIDLKTDFKRPAEKTYNGTTIWKELNADDYALIKNLGREQSASNFMLLMACVNALLYHHSNQTDIVIGTAAGGREDQVLENQIGLFVNSLAIRNRFTEDDSFKSLLDKVKKQTLLAFEHQAYPFDLLVVELEEDRDASRSPLFDVLIAYQNFESNLEYDPEKTTEKPKELFSTVYGMTNDTSKFDITFMFFETNDTISLNLEYNTDLFKDGTIQVMIKKLEKLFHSIAEEPGLKLSEIDFGIEEEKEFKEKNVNLEFDF